MPLPTNYGDQWWLGRETPKTVLEEIRNASTGEVTGYRERNIFTVQMVRSVFNVTSFVSERGAVKSSFTLKTGPSTTIGVSYSGKRFYCTEHTRELVDAETGHYEERQTWVHRSDGEEHPANWLNG